MLVNRERFSCHLRLFGIQSLLAEKISVSHPGLSHEKMNWSEPVLVSFQNLLNFPRIPIGDRVRDVVDCHLRLHLRLSTTA